MFQKYRHIVEHIDVEQGALPRAAEWIAQKGFVNALVVSDRNTDKAAGEALRAMLDAQNVAWRSLVYPEQRLTADEYAIGRLAAAYHPEHDLLVSVGSGTLGDLCKFVAFRVGRPTVCVGTAPSMDGFASAGAAMLLDGMKFTPHTRAPMAIFCDPDILKDAPLQMLAAGLGDMLGKYNALADWKLANLLVGERYDQDIASMMEHALKRCAAAAPGVRNREPQAMKSLVEGLILSGIAMTLFGDSHPASGTEHHLAHYWEMRQIALGMPHSLHGAEVGVATICALELWQMLPDVPLQPEPEDRAATLARVRKAYGRAAEAICAKPNPNVPWEKITQNWPHIRKLADGLPSSESIRAILQDFEAPESPEALHVDRDMLADSVVLARERKKVYTLLQLLGDLGLLKPMAERLNASFFRG